jgi:hypothetical protein
VIFLGRKYDIKGNLNIITLLRRAVFIVMSVQVVGMFKRWGERYSTCLVGVMTLC